jgi:hypothetical protein
MAQASPKSAAAGKAPAKKEATGKAPEKKAAVKQAAIKLPSSKKKAEIDAVRAAASPAQLIDQRIRDLDGWRGELLAQMRALILKADAGIIEEWKWNVPVWSHHGIVCTGESYAKAVKLTFAQGASIADPSGLFSSSLEGNTRRAIDIKQGETLNARAFTALVKAAVAHNASSAKGR